ncbi:MAG: YqjF family protein [Planctomycetota bacterium]
MKHSSLNRLTHRPWKLPTSPWSWRQSWRDLLFAHWPVKAADLQPLVPAPLRVQEFDGTSWVGLVPFRMTGVMRRPLPDLPWVSAFPELNVRLYVEHDGKAGVWFLSLDATNPLAVWAARRFFHLPYFNARIVVDAVGDGIRYTAARPKGLPSLRAHYRPTSAAYESKKGTLDHWLTERYCLYAQSSDGVIWRNEVHHAPWPLQQAEAEIAENTYLSSHGLSIEGDPITLHFARRIDVVVWKAERCPT